MEPLPTLSLGPFWDDFFAVAPADLAPFPPPAHHPPPSPASAARSLATSSVGRPYTASELVFTNASLRAAGWNDKFPVVDQRKPTSSDDQAVQAGLAVLPAWGESTRLRQAPTRSTTVVDNTTTATTTDTNPDSCRSMGEVTTPAEPIAVKAKRTRAGVACTHCRRGQRKCVGGADGRKCDRCVKSNKCCVFEKVNGKQ